MQQDRSRLDCFTNADKFMNSLPFSPQDFLIGTDIYQKQSQTVAKQEIQMMGVQGLIDHIQQLGNVNEVGSVQPRASFQEQTLQYVTGKLEPCGKQLLKQVSNGIKAQQEVLSSTEGMGGTYFFKDENGENISVIKPIDEEPLAPDNPKGYIGRQLGEAGWKPSIRVGEASIRELISYLLDHNNRARVPTTLIVKVQHKYFQSKSGGNIKIKTCKSLKNATSLKQMGGQQDILGGISQEIGNQGFKACKIASLQKYVNSLGDCGDVGYSQFRKQDVHNIGLLDLRLFNMDRHSGNILYRSAQGQTLQSKFTSNEYELIPIDHGYCLPESIEQPYFEWLYWPQASQPFDNDTIQYILNIDIQADLQLLQQQIPSKMLRKSMLRMYEFATTFLQMCIKQNLTLYEIGKVMSEELDLATDSQLQPCDRDVTQLMILAKKAHSLMGERKFVSQKLSIRKPLQSKNMYKQISNLNDSANVIQQIYFSKSAQSSACQSTLQSPFETSANVTPRSQMTCPFFEFSSQQRTQSSILDDVLGFESSISKENQFDIWNIDQNLAQLGLNRNMSSAISHQEYAQYEMFCDSYFLRGQEQSSNRNINYSTYKKGLQEQQNLEVQNPGQKQQNQSLQQGTVQEQEYVNIQNIHSPDQDTIHNNVCSSKFGFKVQDNQQIKQQSEKELLSIDHESTQNLTPSKCGNTPTFATPFKSQVNFQKENIQANKACVQFKLPTSEQGDKMNSKSNVLISQNSRRHSKRNSNPQRTFSMAAKANAQSINFEIMSKMEFQVFMECFREIIHEELRSEHFKDRQYDSAFTVPY